MQNIIGWDVGGAHLKAARVENGIITQAVQIPCPLWLGLGELDRAFFEAEAAVGRAPLNAITMTGELCDAFATREDGVAGLAAIMVRLLSPGRALFYAGRSGFVGDGEASDHAIEVAGPVADTIGTSETLVASALVIVAATALVLLVDEVRSLRRRAVEPVSA